jgi:uncharacterized protein (TIGR02466 family)
MSNPSRAIGLFPTPLLHAPGVLEPSLVAALSERFAGAASLVNVNSAKLSHTAILSAEEDAQIRQLGARIGPRLEEFGELLFGERLPWIVKELWFNVLETGGHQSLHNHANSLVSGVIYLTPVHAASSTVFVKALGQPAYVFQNAHAQTSSGPFSASKWAMPAVAPGDLVLFPSYLLHEVPVNPGPQRITLAFNAIPSRLNSWGYTIGLSA